MAILDKDIQILMLKGEKGDPGVSGDYNGLQNKPKINGVELIGDKLASDLGLASTDDLNTAVGNITTNATNIAANTASIGNLSSLTTTTKTNLVAAINEVNSDTFSKNVEYGTWTPTLLGVYGVNPTYTLEYVDTMYYRIGDLVYISFYIRAIITAVGSGQACIGGLPFTARAVSDRQAVSFSNVGNFDQTSLISIPEGKPYLRITSATGVIGSFKAGNFYIGASGVYIRETT